MSIQPVSRFQCLLDGFLNDALTPSELDEFLSLLANETVQNKLELSDSVISALKNRSFVNSSTSEDALKEYKKFENYVCGPRATSSVHRVHFLRRGFLRYAAAIIILFGIGAYLWNTNLEQGKRNLDRNEESNISAPSQSLATITLSNGEKIDLDSLPVGQIASEGNVIIEKQNDGKIVYSGLGENQILYNTISVPRGSKMSSLTLSDGSIVFLNSESSLTYPVTFNGADRHVEITGEAYFQIAKNKNKKFLVKSRGVITEVLGTSFNITSYSDEAETKITLVEGGIKVSSGNENIIVKPGEQVEASTNNNALRLNRDANILEITAWQKGKFVFSKTKLSIILKQVSRWYNVEVINRSKNSSQTFSGGLSRKSPLSEVIEMLQSNGLNCSIHGSTLIIEDK